MKHTETIPAQVSDYLKQLGAGPDQISNLLRFEEALQRENRINNLISRADVENIWTRHILHSLMPLVVCTLPADLRVVDIGSGGGLPGIPIAILRPAFHLFLVDSIRKKTESLRRIVSAIGLSNVTVVNKRVEEMAADTQFRGSIDLCIARAVAPLSKLIQWASPLLRQGDFQMNHPTGGRIAINRPALISLKGGDISDEIDQAKRMFPAVSIEVCNLVNILEEKKIVITYREVK